MQELNPKQSSIKLRISQMNPGLNAIVVVHRGNSRWLSRSLRAASITNPGVEVVLIGDNSGLKLARDLGVSHAEWRDFSSSAGLLAKNYVHKSTNGRAFELICLQRWFILESWMRETGQESVIAIDSDLLVFADLKEILKASLQRDAVGFVNDSAHLAWIPNASAISAVCNVIQEAYSDPSHQLIQQLHCEHLHRFSEGGVSDMSFFQLLARDGSGRVIDILGPHGEKCWYLDVTMNDGIGGFVLDNGFKRIKMIEGVPHALSTEAGVWHPMATLHFQGKAKALMDHYFAANSNFKTKAISANDRRILFERLQQRLRTLFIRSE